MGVQGKLTVVRVNRDENGKIINPEGKEDGVDGMGDLGLKDLINSKDIK